MSIRPGRLRAMSTVLAPPLRYAILCELDDLPVGLGRAFRVGGRSVAVFRTRTGRVFAVANECPHKGGLLADGMLAGELVVCPLHAYRFDPESGSCDQDGVCGIATYAVEVNNGFVRIGMPVA
jgi:nitrite reductase (NADH) small subunit